MTSEKLKQYRHLVKEYADVDNERLKKHIRAEIDEIEDFIENLEGDETKRIFKLRYMEGLTWLQIASRLSISGDGSTERKKHNRYLNKKVIE